MFIYNRKIGNISLLVKINKLICNRLYCDKLYYDKYMTNYIFNSYFINNLLYEKKFLEEKLSKLKKNSSKIMKINIESRLNEIDVKFQEIGYVAQKTAD